MTERISTIKELQEKIAQINDFIKTRANAKKEILKFPSPYMKETSDDIPANIVIAEAFNQLKDVIICGVDHEDKWWFSLSMGDGAYAMWVIEHFKQLLLDSDNQVEYNEGREI